MTSPASSGRQPAQRTKGRPTHELRRAVGFVRLAGVAILVRKGIEEALGEEENSTRLLRGSLVVDRRFGFAPCEVLCNRPRRPPPPGDDASPHPRSRPARSASPLLRKRRKLGNARVWLGVGHHRVPISIACFLFWSAEGVEACAAVGGGTASSGVRTQSLLARRHWTLRTHRSTCRLRVRSASAAQLC